MFLYPERSEGLARGLIASDIVILAPCGCERNGTPDGGQRSYHRLSTGSARPHGSWEGTTSVVP